MFICAQPFFCMYLEDWCLFAYCRQGDIILKFRPFGKGRRWLLGKLCFVENKRSYFVGRGLAPAEYLKPRPLGDVAPSGDGEGLTVGTDVLGCVEYLLFSGEEKRSKKVAGTLAAVSRTPQRFFGERKPLPRRAPQRFLGKGVDKRSFF